MYLASSYRVISDTGIYQGMYQRIHESRQTSFEWILLYFNLTIKLSRVSFIILHGVRSIGKSTDYSILNS